MTSFFPPDYATAKERFRAAATALGWRLDAHPTGGVGPRGEALTIDVAVGKGPRQDQALVLSSGVHGVEGFFGSAVQLSLMDEWAARPASRPPMRCVMIHAVNPFGFAWRRRVNESNVDINRNLLRDGEAFRGSPAGYAHLDPLLNPRRPPSRWEPVMLKFLVTIARHGMPALKEAIASGQYDFPRGLFFGGAAPSASNDILTYHLGEWIGDARQVTHLYLHTGLGRRGTGKLLIDYALTPAQHARLTAWFGAGSFEEPRAHAVAYPTRGSFGQWCVSRFPGRDYLHACAEFGTYPATTVLAGLRAENQASHWQANAEALEAARARLAELFCPASDEWRTQVMAESRAMVAKTIEGMGTIANR